MKELTLPESVEYIGSYIIRGTEIESIVVPKSVTNCGNEALSGATKLKKVVFEEGIETIPDNILDSSNYQNQIEEIVIPKTVTRVGDYAFRGSKHLKKVTFTENPEVDEDGKKHEVTIDMGAFINCSALDIVELSENVVSIYSEAFEGCSSLKELILPESVEFISSYFIKGTGIESIVVPKSATNRGSEALS